MVILVVMKAKESKQVIGIILAVRAASEDERSVAVLRNHQGSLSRNLSLGERVASRLGIALEGVNTEAGWYGWEEAKQVMSRLSTAATSLLTRELARLAKEEPDNRHFIKRVIEDLS